jgi:hypothetical protein
MNDDQPRTAHLEFCWDVPEGELFKTKAEAQENRPEGAQRLLQQWRWDDDGEFIGHALEVTA